MNSYIGLYLFLDLGLQDIGQRHLSVTSLGDLFESVGNRIVIDFDDDTRT